MTGFASLTGEALAWTWTWDIRAVNARGLDIRLRLPDWLDGLDQPVRAALSKGVTRGIVTLGLRVQRADAEITESVDQDVLHKVLSQIADVTEAATKSGVTLAVPSATDVLAMRGVLSSDAAEEDAGPLVKALIDNFAGLLAAFQEMRQGEGSALARVIAGQLDEVERLVDAAALIAEQRKDQWTQRLKDNLARVMETADSADPDRMAQELAMIVVKSDVTEEIDRLRAHVEAARELLHKDAPIGRKFDFLAQELNREANTLCAKAQATDLTRVGLDLKAVIDQMREQVQNVE